MGKCGLLCLIQILKKCSCCYHTAVIILNTKSFQRIYMKMLLQCTLTETVIKIPVIQWKDADTKAVLQIIGINSAHKKSVIADDFRRDEFVDLIQKLLRFVNFCKKTVTCCDICDGTAKMIFH